MSKSPSKSHKHSKSSATADASEPDSQEITPMASYEGNSVEVFMQIVPQILAEIAAYVAEGESDPQTEGNIRQLKVMTSALMGSLNAIRTA